ncbi:hypothetical protein [Noviherbaspirillum aerium]|uniref:hypothetical protein n=1 Tax=Noviherbaspirillum aerium TaxID=2588497 RepID=UPI00124CF4C1|nr:hypothetical protein [Noviherbaspirillum aerium]
MKLRSCISDAISSFRKHPTSPQAPAAPASSSGHNVGFAFNDHTGDPNRNLYASHMQGVLRSATQDDATSQKLIGSYHAGLMKAVASEAAPAETEPVGIKKYAMEKMYLEAGKNLEEFLKANRFPIPDTILKGKLTYAEDAAIRAREIAFKDLGRADADPDVLALKKGDIKQRLRGERQLAKYKNLFNFTKAKLAEDVETLTELFIPVTNKEGIKTGVKVKAETIDDLASFFQEKFNIKLTASETRNARQAFLSKQSVPDPAQQADTKPDGPNAAQQEILDRYLTRLLSKLPLATSSQTNATEAAAISKQGIFRLAETVAGEAIFQARVADTDKCTAFSVSGGSSLVVKGSKGDDFDFKLCQPYGQENNQRCFYELAFIKNEDTQQYGLRLQRLLPGEDNQPPSPESIPLEGDAAQQRRLLESYFSKSDLKLLFGLQPGIGHKSFSELYGHLKAQALKDDKIEDIVFQHLDSAIADHFAKEGIDSIQGTGYFYNKGLYGKDYLTDMRGPYNSRVAKLLVAGKLAATGSCGFQQDLIHAQRGKIIAIPNVTRENYLNSFHGNDPQEVNEKQTIHAIVPNSARAAEYEAPLAKVDYDPEETRQAMAGTPISHLDNRAALKAVDASMNVVTASRRNEWAPRENVPLSIPVSIERNVNGETRVDTRNFQFKIKGKEVLMASAHLSLTHAEGAFLRQDGTISQEDLVACESLQLTHMLPEGWGLRDDEGKAVLDPETREPVRLLEKVIVRPVVTGTTIDKVADTVEKEITDKDNPGENKTINVPLFQDETGATVLEKRNEYGEPVQQFNAGGLLSPVFVNEAGEPAVGKVTPMTRNVTNEVRGFEIVGIERWVREPIEDPARPGTAKTKGDHVLCTYVKKVQSADKGNLNPLILCDPVYTTINCVHSQNGLNTPAANENMGPLDTVGHSYRPGDTPYAQDQIMAVSKDRPYPHPVAVERGVPREQLVTEDVAFALGGGVGASASQPHRDMDNSGFSPYTLYEHKQEVPEVTRGQRYGNREAIGQGRILKARQEHLEKVMEKAQEARENRRKFANSEIIAPLIAKLGRLDLDGAKPWTLYENTRNKDDLDNLLQLLKGVGHAFTDDCARRLEYQKAYLDEVSSALEALNTRLQDVRNAISATGARSMTDQSFLDTRVQQMATMRGHLKELVERYSDGSTFAEVKSSVKTIVDNFGVIEEQLKNHFEKKSGSGSVDRDESANPYAQLDIELVQCKNAIKGLQVWERQPDVIRRELVAMTGALKAELEKDWTTDAPHPLISHLVDGRQGATTPGNDKLAGRYRTGIGNDLHALLSLRDIDDMDTTRFGADKEAINARLTRRLAELHTKALEMNALKGTSEFNAAGFKDVQQEIDRITTAQIAYQDARDMASFDANTRATRIAELESDLNARLEALKQISETHTGMSPEASAAIMQDIQSTPRNQESLRLDIAQTKRRLAAWKTFDKQVRAFETPEPVPASLARIGKVGLLDEMRVVESQMVARGSFGNFRIQRSPVAA